MKLLKNGSRGAEVEALQAKLNLLGFDPKIDGIFGTGTEKIVRNEYPWPQARPGYPRPSPWISLADLLE
ncbi:MAG: peptidoglycan-binding protein [Sandaracinus sp.]|nr:peptidoglycan-binding protein [Sandaracinus sp.]MCB9633385.1 peptidoglycan-binding protein [Sandaracinus sp.]